MSLLNYTTSISAEKTVGEITKILASHGAKRVITEYSDRQVPIGVAFVIDTPYGVRGFNLPCNIDAVWTVLRQQRARGKIRSDRFVTKEQAARVGWRVLKDWIEADRVQDGGYLDRRLLGASTVAAHLGVPAADGADPSLEEAMSELTERQRGILRDMAERGGVIYYPHYVQVTGKTRMQFPSVPVDDHDVRAIFDAGLVEIDEEQSNVTGERFRITDAGRRAAIVEDDAAPA